MYYNFRYAPYQASVVFAGDLHHPAVMRNLMADPFDIDVHNFIEVTECLPLLRINGGDYVSENVRLYFVIQNNIAIQLSKMKDNRDNIQCIKCTLLLAEIGQTDGDGHFNKVF